MRLQDEEQDEERPEDPQLRIAWQYRRYIQRQQQQQASQRGVAEPPLAKAGTPILPDTSQQRPYWGTACRSRPRQQGRRGNTGTQGQQQWCCEQQRRPAGLEPRV